MKISLLVRKFIKKVIAIIYFIFSLSISSIVFAEDTTPTSFGDVSSLGEYVGKVFTWASSIIGSVAVVVIIFAGYRYMTSAGNPEQAEKAKKLIITAISSLVLVILAIFIIKAINPNIQLGF